ncbi:hypothetical protein D3C75_996930 [compost metagenome]
MQACHQLKEGKRFAQVIIGAVTQAPDAIFHTFAGGEHDHRGLLARTQGAQHAEAVEARQHHVEDDHRVVALQRQMQAFDPIPRQVHGVTLFRQAAVQIVRGFFFVFDNQNAHDPPQSVVASTGSGAGLGRWNRRSSHKYMTGVVNSVSAWLTSKPPTTAIPRGWRNSAPVP